MKSPSSMRPLRSAEPGGSCLDAVPAGVKGEGRGLRMRQRERVNY